MKEHLQRRTCDRCGAVTFEPYNKVIDCGFYHKFEFVQTEGWTCEEAYGDLCPECNEALMQTRKKFMQGKAL